MAYTDFYIQSGGSDLNSGSTTANAASYTSSAGNWSTVTNQFTPTDGSTPASSVGVGDWVSIYSGAPNKTNFVAQVTAVAAGVNGAITVSTTQTYGTAPATASGTISLKDGGAHADTEVWTGYGNTVTAPVSTRVNVQAGTYTIAGARSVAMKGATTAPLWFRGYNTTPGDLDNGSATLAYPVISQGANTVTFSGGYVLVTGLSFTGSVAGNLVVASTNSPVEFRHCRFVNTSANSAAAAINGAITGVKCLNCYFQTPSTASQIVKNSAAISLVGCWLQGAGSGSTQVGLLSTQAVTVENCTFDSCGSHGISINTTAQVVLDGVTFYGCLGDSVRFVTNVPAAATNSYVRDCAFYLSGGFDINNSTGTNTANISLWNNLFYLPTSGHLNGFGDWGEYNALTDSSQSYVSGTDLHLVSGSNGAGAGLPGQWENQTAGLTSTPDVGAWQRPVSASSGGPPCGSIVCIGPQTYGDD